MVKSGFDLSNSIKSGTSSCNFLFTDFKKWCIVPSQILHEDIFRANLHNAFLIYLDSI